MKTSSFTKWTAAVLMVLGWVVAAPAGLEINKSVKNGLTSTPSGQTFTYKLQYRAASTTTPFFNATLVVDPLPPGIEFQSLVGTVHVSNYVYNAGTRVLTVNFVDPLPAGSTGEIEVNVRFTPGTTLPGTIATNTVTMSAGNAPPATSQPVTITAVASNRMTATKSLTGTIPLDQNVTYTVTANNSQTVASLNATNVTLVDLIPPGAVFVAASGGGVYDAGAGTVTWTTPTLNAGSTFSRTITLKYPSTAFSVGSSVTNNLTVTATPLGGSPTNLTARTIHAIVAPVSNSTFTKDVNANYVYEGKPTAKAWTFTLSNTGNVPMENVVVTDAIPAQVEVTTINVGLPAGTPPGQQSPISLFYQTNLDGAWTAAPGNPYAATSSVVVAVSALGLAPGEYVSALKWDFGTLPVGYSVGGLQFNSNILTNDHNGVAVTAGTIVSNTGVLAYSDFSGSKVKIDPATLIVKTQRPVAELTKTASPSTVNDGGLTTFTVRLTNRTEAAQPLVNPVLADLLDAKLQYVPGTWVVASKPVGAPDPVFEPVANYNGTGRTLLRWKWTGASAYSLPINSFIEMRFQARVPAGTIYGAINNDLTLAQWGNTDLDSSGATGATDVNDLDGDGSITDPVLYKRATITVAARVSMDSIKVVKGALDSDWSIYPANGQTVPGGLADYRLTVRNSGNVPMTSVTVVDILPFVGDAGVIDLSPRDSVWRPSLVGPVVAPPGVTVYYSTSANPTRPEMDPSGPPGSTDPEWSTTPPADITRVRSLKFDFGSIVIQPAQERELTWPMRAPVGTVTDGSVAWNSFGFISKRTDSGTFLLPSEPIKVGIAIHPDTNAVYGDRIWFDTNTNGVQEAGEVGVNGIRVDFYEDSSPSGFGDGIRDTNTDRFVGFTMSGDDFSGQPGYYNFPNLDRGNYYAVFSVPSFYLRSPVNTAPTNTDSDVNPVSNMTPITDLDAAEKDPTWDCGLFLPPYGVELVKTAGATPDGGIHYINANNPVTYTYRVTNTGELALVDLRINDDKLGYIGVIPGPLAVGASAILTKTAPAVVNPVTNLATVTAAPADDTGHEIPGAPRATDTDDAIVKIYAALGDKVWYDNDRDGVQDAGEAGVAGVLVTLYDATGTPVSTRTTGAAGTYLFDSLFGGTYSVGFSSLPAGYVFTGRDLGGDDAKDSDPSHLTGRTADIVLALGERDLRWDAGIFRPIPGIRIVKTAGTAADGGIHYINTGDDVLYTYLVTNIGETHLGGIAVTDDKLGSIGTIAGPLAPGASTTLTATAPAVPGAVTNIATADGNPTDSDGNDLPTLPNVTDTDDAIVKLFASLGDYVWYDGDQDGIQDGGETPVGGVAVTLYNATGAVVRTTSTAPDGTYHFTSLLPGDYQVGFELPAGHVLAPRDRGGNDAQDSDADLATGRTAVTTLVAGENDLTWDAGVFRPTAGIVLVKTAASAADGATWFANLNDAVTYTYVVSNTGNAFLSGIAVTDDKLGAIGTIPGPLAPGATAVLTATSAPLGASVTNIATAVGNPTDSYGNDLPGVPDVTDSDDAVVRLTTAIGDRVWYDENMDGLQDAGEPGVAGVIATLYDSTGGVVRTMTTLADGAYLFDYLPPGTYSVGFSKPDGHAFTLVDTGADDRDSDADRLTGRTTPTELTDGERDLTWDVGVFLARPGIQVVKTAGSAADGAVWTVKSGTDVTYTYRVINTGNTYLANIAVTDDKLGAVGTIPGPLAPGTETTLTKLAASVLIDVTNIVTAAGTPTNRDGVPVPGLPAVQDTDDAIVDVLPLDVELTKESRPTSYPSKWTIPITKGEQFVDGDYWLRLEYGTPSFDVWGPGNVKASGTTLDADWHHVVGRFTRGTNAWGPHTLDIFVDGQRVVRRVATGATDTSSAPLYLGAYLGNSFFYAGGMDEIRLSRQARGDAWLATSWKQQADPTAFLTAGAEQAGTVMDYRKTLTVAAASVAGDLTNFPVLVKLIDADLGAHVARPEGWDIAFTLPDGTPLAHEIESYGATRGELVAWVKLPALSSAADTPFVVHYGDASVVAPPAGAASVWDGDYVMVQHLDEAGPVVHDSTSFGNDGTVSGARFSAFGAADGAYVFDGVDDKITIPNNPSIQFTTDFTIEGWFSRTVVPADVMYHVTVTNKGPGLATGLNVTDQLPAGLEFGDYTATRGVYDPTSGVWSVDWLPEGGSAEIWIAADRTGTGSVTNVAEVSALDQDDVDSIPGNGAPGEDDIGFAGDTGSGGTAKRPDFAVTSVVLNPAIPAAGAPYNVIVTVVNKGEAAGDGGVLKVWGNRFAPAVPGEAADAQAAVGSLGVGASRTITVGGLLGPAAAGTYNVRAFVDANDTTAEQNEGNNQLTATYTRSAGPPPAVGKADFVVTALSTVPDPLSKGASFAAVVTIRNAGEAAGNAGKLRVWVNRFASALPGESGSAEVAAGVLAVGESRTLTVGGLTAPAAIGTYTLRAFVDADNAVAEQSEGNNQATKTYALNDASAEKPDFVVTAVETTALTAGGAFTATVTVRNQGAAAGDAGQLRIWKDHFANATAGETGDATQTVGVLASGQSKALVFSGLTAPTAMGTYNLRAFVDADNGAVEQSEGNNQKTKTYTFSTGSTAKPDFSITEISFSPSTLVRGGTFTAYVTVRNQGAVGGNAGYLDVWVDRYASAAVGDIGDAYMAVGVLAAGEAKTITITGLQASGLMGTHTFRAFVDSRGTVAEQSEGNNQKTKTYGFY